MSFSTRHIARSKRSAPRAPPRSAWVVTRKDCHNSARSRVKEPRHVHEHHQIDAKAPRSVIPYVTVRFIPAERSRHPCVIHATGLPPSETSALGGALPGQRTVPSATVMVMAMVSKPIKPRVSPWLLWRRGIHTICLRGRAPVQPRHVDSKERLRGHQTFWIPRRSAVYQHSRGHLAPHGRPSFPRDFRRTSWSHGRVAVLRHQRVLDHHTATA